MIDKTKQVQLAKYRLQQAEESLDEAGYLFSGKKSPRSVINRVYYSMFYAVLALLIFEPYSSSKHSGVLSYFNKEFIKNGIFPKDMGYSINKAFELRQTEDYREYGNLTSGDVQPYIDKAGIFIKKVREYLEKKVF